MTKPARPAGAVQALVARISEDILFGRRPPRARLVEDDLIAETGATRHAVRAALQALARDGLVVHHPHRSAQVRSFTAAEVEEITEFRAMLHAEAARRIPLPPPRGLLEALSAIEAAHAGAVARSDLSAIHAENERFHATLFAACGNRHLAATIRDQARLSLVFRCYALAEPELARRGAREHRAMLAALRRGDGAELVRLCAAHASFAAEAYRRVLARAAVTQAVA
jgi:DNA-binding GntR family transcriptional regulator